MRAIGTKTNEPTTRIRAPRRRFSRVYSLALVTFVLALAAAQFGVHTLHQREIVCWGDSMTAGVGASAAVINTPYESYDASNQSYPEILEHFTHLPTYNMGVSGAASDEIVAMQDAFVTFVAENAASRAEKGDIGKGWYGNGDVIILEIGSNGGWDQDFNTLIGQYYAMIARSGCSNYLILGDTDDPGTSIADTEQKPFEKNGNENKTAWETALENEFGDRFINMRLYLIANGLDDVGIEAGIEDKDLAARGCISRKLRADWTHLNSFGYYSKAKAIYMRGVALGYWT